MAQEVILRLDEEQDFRQLSEAEFSLRAKLKKRIMGWLVIERARKKQCARISAVHEGDANTVSSTSGRMVDEEKTSFNVFVRTAAGHLTTMIKAASSRSTLRTSCAPPGTHT